jgi:hypothetical protein
MKVKRELKTRWQIEQLVPTGAIRQEADTSRPIHMAMSLDTPLSLVRFRQCHRGAAHKQVVERCKRSLVVQWDRQRRAVTAVDL